MMIWCELHNYVDTSRRDDDKVIILIRSFLLLCNW